MRREKKEERRKNRENRRGEIKPKNVKRVE
jgi:hypothetical protein